jgi:hypothetical protein
MAKRELAKAGCDLPWRIPGFAVAPEEVKEIQHHK